MTDEEKHERMITDLAKTAVDRARKSVTLVTQLLDGDDDDTDIAFVLTSVAADMINGSAYHLWQSEEDMTEAQALGHVLKGLFVVLGFENVRDAINAVPPGRKSCGGS